MDIIYIRTSDRSSFRRCRRKWGWSSHLRGNMEPKLRNKYFWIGSGVHYSLEDFHSYKHFESPAEAFRAYTEACKHTKGFQLPDEWKDQAELAESMLDYYSLDWLKGYGRSPLQTFVHNGEAQVEVRFEIVVPLKGPNGEEIRYRGTLDRVAIDEHGRLWIVEYKTAAQFVTAHFDTDGQVTAYVWAGNSLYNKPITGVIYQQHRKTLAEEPRLLANGKISSAKNQLTSYAKYKAALEALYQSVDKAPATNIQCLNHLASKESEDQDPYIRRDWIYRNEHQLQAEGAKILMELEDILNPDLPLYPNPTRDCSWGCDFQTACISLDDGSDWEFHLKDEMQQREKDTDSWRTLLPGKAPTVKVIPLQL